MTALHVLTKKEQALHHTDQARVGAWWSAGAWERVAPVLRVWALAAVPSTYGMSLDDREDIASILCFRAWRLGFVPENPQAWVTFVTKNLVRDWRKRASNQHERFDAYAALDDYESPAPLPDACIDRDEQVRLIRRAVRLLATLDPITRTCVIEMSAYDVSSKVLGPALKLEPSAVRMRATRGRAELRRAMQRLERR